ncbi:DUF2165 domain-containing protein [Streptomyces sp. AV19]|uniref:DUF2165 domain-containing protein n=1 Tax=Streptomyces sp. AV19 TaxID=2793068 RepID=UPI0018FEBE81|nr:DUF2165 domain-containing protein [Streptomyces sp. AV19]MBH1936619.1 DUF2165 domain-containing protein [Streptomyces sp. AV19]MDG4532680.1 DUF2165 domain-containing protein [Streptomyces sp. AV19]
MRKPAVLGGGLPVAATALTATVAVYILLVVLGNVTDFDTNRDFVRHVLAMDTTYRDEDLMWRAVTSRTLQDLAYLLIIAWEAATAAVLLAATARWARALRRGGYERARRTATLGLVMFLLLFGLGFIAIGGEWFAMWQSPRWNGLAAAQRNFLVAGLTLLVIHLPGRRDADRL